MRFSRLRTITLFALLVGSVVAVPGLKYAYTLRERKLQALFVGSYEASQVSKPIYYPRFSYDLKAYRSYTEEAFPSGAEAILLPERKPELRLKWIGQLEGVDAVTSATMSVQDRLQWHSAYKEQIPPPSLWITYPPDGAVFPLYFCEPSSEWEDRVNNVWQVTVGISGTSRSWSFLTDKRRWEFPPEVWRGLREKAVGNDAWIQVKGIRRTKGYEKRGGIQASQVVHFRISADRRTPM